MRAHRLCLLLGPLLLVGCEEPFTEPGTWHATGVTQGNTDAQVTDKTDSVAGRGDPGSDGTLDTAAAIRLYEDKAKPLKIEATTTGGGS